MERRSLYHQGGRNLKIRGCSWNHGSGEEMSMERNKHQCTGGDEKMRIRVRHPATLGLVAEFLEQRDEFEGGRKEEGGIEPT